GLLQHFLFLARRVAADMQQRQHQRGELVAHGQAGKAHGDVGAGATDLEGRAALVLGGADGDLVRERGDVLQQLAQLARGLAVVQRGIEFDRRAQVLQVGRELRLQVVVQHGVLRDGGEACACGQGAPGGARKHPGMVRGGAGPGACPGPVRLSGGDQILPTSSRDGAMVLAPSFHLAGQTWFGLAATNWAAFSLRRVSLMSRAMALSWTSMVLITPLGSITKVPRRARPSSSMCTPKARVRVWVGSPTSGNLALPTAGEVSCHTL